MALHNHLRERTDLADAVMERQRGAFDGFFDDPSLDSFEALCVLFAVGLPLTADFVARIAPALGDDAAAAVLLESLGGRGDIAAFAARWLRDHSDDSRDAKDQVQSVVAELTGRALTSFQRVVQDTDALAVLLAQDEAPDQADRAVRDVLLEVLDAHRRRLAAMGLDDPS